MESQNKAAKTEKIKNEDWCASCEKWVDQWNVFFEANSEWGYDKIRRCPHCHEKCYGDSDTGLECFCFFVGLFGVPMLCMGLLTYFNLELELPVEGEAKDWLWLLLGGASGIALSFIASHLQKRWWYRNRIIADQNRSLPTPPAKPDRY